MGADQSKDSPRTFDPRSSQNICFNFLDSSSSISWNIHNWPSASTMPNAGCPFRVEWYHLMSSIPEWLISSQMVNGSSDDSVSSCNKYNCPIRELGGQSSSAWKEEEIKRKIIYIHHQCWNIIRYLMAYKMHLNLGKYLEKQINTSKLWRSGEGFWPNICSPPQYQFIFKSFIYIQTLEMLAV